MVAVIARRRKLKASGLRPMEPSRDLAGVARLIQTAFADELDRSGQAALREMRNMSRLGPLLRWIDGANIELSQLLSGFVWVEEGQIVGNVTVSRAAPGSRRWVISNVAVAEPYRSQGIARALMDAAIELIREWSGHIVTLQVREDNDPAVHLYQSMGFREIFGTAYLRLDRVPEVTPIRPEAARLRPRRFTSTDARREYDLACAATPERVQIEQPIRLRRYRLGLDQSLADGARGLVGGGPTLRLVLEGQGGFKATIAAETGTWWSEGRIFMTVHPASRGQVEKVLASHALHYLRRRPRRVTLIRHPNYHPEGIEVFMSFGFREQRTLLWMRRDL